MSPRGRLIGLFVLAGLPLVASVWYPEGLQIGLAANLVLVGLALVDRILTPRMERVRITREVSKVLSVGTSNPVVLRVANRTSARVTVEIADDPPEPCVTEGLPVVLRVPAGRTREASYRLTPLARGLSSFASLYVRYPSRLGLWTMLQRRPVQTPVRIYPDIKAVTRFELLARKNRLAEEGLKLWRLRGSEGEFERLREYRREDDLRKVDWKATAKYQKLISRDYVVERNQNVLFMLDCGRSMVNETGGISHLDRGLNSAIMLAYIALSQGDNVALLAFSNRIERMVGPVRGKLAVRTLIREVYDLEARYEASDYSLAIEEVLRRQRKRALVVLVTHALDEQHLISIGEYVRTLTNNHLLLCVLLRDEGLTTLASKPPVTELDAFHAAAAAEILAAQGRMVRKLQRAGVLVVETLPGELAAVIINQYLDLKARHRL